MGGARVLPVLCTGGLPFGLAGASLKGRPPTVQNHYLARGRRGAAIPLQIAEAACRLILAGAATKGARKRQLSFDPIDFRIEVLGDVDTGGAVMHTNPDTLDTA